VRDDDEQGHGDQHVKGSGRLERTLEKLFDRVDANHDGSVDKGELANALAQVNGGQAPSGASTTSAPQTTPATNDSVPPAAAPDAPGTGAPVAPAEGQPVASASVTSVIYVAIAVQQYTAIGDMR
jgi:type V secretory pathway adhesin AidA